MNEMHYINWPTAVTVIGSVLFICITLALFVNGWPEINIHKHYHKKNDR